MKPRFDVRVLAVQEIQELPEAWTSEDYKNILELADFEDWDEIEESQLKDYTILALQDFESQEAAAIILEYQFQDRLSHGQIQNMSNEMMDEKLWEEYQKIDFHRELYNCAVLAKWAFPASFPETDAIKCTIEVAPENQPAIEIMEFIDKSLITRLLANGMGDHSIIKRLFSNRMDEGMFPEAEDIIWIMDKADHNRIIVHSSNYWLNRMNQVQHYSSEAFTDSLKNNLVKVH